MPQVSRSVQARGSWRSLQTSNLIQRLRFEAVARLTVGENRRRRQVTDAIAFQSAGMPMALPGRGSRNRVTAIASGRLIYQEASSTMRGEDGDDAG